MLDSYIKPHHQLHYLPGHYLHGLIVTIVIMAGLLAHSHTVSADSLEALLMPGDVISAHEEYEQECEQCHDTSDKKRQSRLCMECHAHEDIFEDIQSSSGFHGQLPVKQQGNCKHCHTEHKGRSANVILFDTTTFDHGRTDFMLEGMHRKTNCEACHLPEKKYSEAPGDCYSCHEKADVHKGEQGKKCDSCHDASSWRKTDFDHSKTDFPLDHSHEDTACNACHLNQKYKDTPKTCISCHQIQDIHQGEFGKKCDSCHDTKRWTEVIFDHNKKTDFPLHGKHKKASCNSCHKPGSFKSSHSEGISIKLSNKESSLTKQCYDCHKNDDAHKGQYGRECKDCHNESSWQKPKFDHGRQTDFTLFGKHKKASCNQCHRGDVHEEELKKDCYSCHAKDDIHDGQQGEQCDSCHNEKGWNHDVLFDHDLASFPLIGMHAVTQCEECHLSAQHGETESDCNHCHASDDVHETRLGTDCAYCHNPNSWNNWLFDHEKSSGFAIDGAHQELGCYDCHQVKSGKRPRAAKDCISCHRSEDIHERQFGRHCGDCHNTRRFKGARISR